MGSVAMLVIRARNKELRVKDYVARACCKSSRNKLTAKACGERAQRHELTVKTFGQRA